MLRMKRIGGGEVNVSAFGLLAFIDKDKGSTIVLNGGLSYDVEESPRTIRNMLDKNEKSVFGS